MVSRRILVARHGQTEWNREGRQQGRLDSPLTSLGRGQARAVAELLRGFSVDGALSSPMGRALETASTISEALGVPLIIIEDLAELDLGEISGLTWTEFEARHPGARQTRSKNWYHWEFPGGESCAVAEERAVTALRLVENSGFERPVIVAHEMINRMLLKVLLDLDVDAARALTHPNDVIYEVDVEAFTASMHKARQLPE